MGRAAKRAKQQAKLLAKQQAEEALKKPTTTTTIVKDKDVPDDVEKEEIIRNFKPSERLTFNLCSEIKNLHLSYGIINNDYTQYRQYCSRRIR